MSRVQGKPFIESLVESLTPALRDGLLGLINGSDKTPEFRSLVNKEHLITDSDKNKVQYIVLETWNRTYTGYLVYNNSYCILIGFHSNTQELQLVDINCTKQTCCLIKQPLNILELRMYLRDPEAHTTAGEIDSGDAPKGKVLTADGASGASWEDAANVLAITGGESGTLSDAQFALAQANNTIIEYNGYRYYKESQDSSSIVYKAAARISEGTTYIDKISIAVSSKEYAYSSGIVATGGSVSLEFDASIDPTSTNAPQNKAVAEALDGKLNNTIHDYQENTDTKFALIVDSEGDLAVRFPELN